MLFASISGLLYFEAASNVSEGRVERLVADELGLPIYEDLQVRVAERACVILLELLVEVVEGSLASPCGCFRPISK